ncbi:MAG: diaminopimelate decarboxylase [Flavobacteriales bacterium]|jgi:diaminopimelate decarboxylase|nr:diaminopimelate decarboxylase [Flavobacteriales bacterium]
MKLTLDKIENLETPRYVYDLGILRKTLKSAAFWSDKYNFHIHYAVKANFENRILQEISKKGFGADCVSGREVEKSIEMGFAPQNIVLAGVGKTDWEIETALKQEISCINIESLEEIEVINQIATSLGKTAKIALRVNPNIDAKTHPNITTGLKENKFGIREDQLLDALNLVRNSLNCQFEGLHFHIGSQITEMDVFENLCKKVNKIKDQVKEQGFEVKTLNLGGGLGVDYSKSNHASEVDFELFFGTIDKNIQREPNQKICFELGRSLVANCGYLLSKVLYTKKGKEKSFLILDAGMTELLRPALYQASHLVENISSSSIQDAQYDVVGPICESSDIFARNLKLPLSKRGDFIVIHSAGAYSSSMANEYNLRKKYDPVYQG